MYVVPTDRSMKHMGVFFGPAELGQSVYFGPCFSCLSCSHAGDRALLEGA